MRKCFFLGLAVALLASTATAQYLEINNVTLVDSNGAFASNTAAVQRGNKADVDTSGIPTGKDIFVRLYDSGGNVVKQVRLSKGKQQYTVPGNCPTGTFDVCYALWDKDDEGEPDDDAYQDDSSPPSTQLTVN